MAANNIGPMIIYNSTTSSTRPIVLPRTNRSYGTKEWGCDYCGSANDSTTFKCSACGAKKEYKGNMG